jgi:hypothetical protein
MSAEVRRLVVFSAAAAIALILLGVFPPTGVVRIYLLGVIALAGVLAAGKTLAQFGRLDRLPRRPKLALEEPDEPAFFGRAKRRIELATASGVYFEQLRPRLREIAEQRLASRGVRFTTSEAQQLLGERAWLALERRPEGDKFAPPPEGELAHVIGALERL